jgi:hypothetical protein
LNDQHYELKPIGRVESPLVDRAAAPKQSMKDLRMRGLRSMRASAMGYVICVSVTK